MHVLRKISSSCIIFSLPEHFSLVKDSGLWSIYDDNTDTTVFSQLADETERRFILRAAHGLLSNKEFSGNLFLNTIDVQKGKIF